MSRKYSSWASNQSLINPDSPMMRLTTVAGNEQDQLKNFDRVEAIPHMYINVDIPPPPMTKSDARASQPITLSRQNSSYFAAPTVIPPPTNIQTKIWPVEKPSRNPSVIENGSTTPSKRTHKHKHHHHHHHHHSDKNHHHHHHRHHHNRRHRAKSSESSKHRQNQPLLSSSKVMLANPQYLDPDQQQSMIVYREVPNGEGYTVDHNGYASVPYGTENETTLVDDQQTPVVVYRDANLPQQQQQQQQQQILTDGMPQEVFYNQDQEGFIQQNDPFICLPQQQQQHQHSSQILYCTDSNQQDYLCTSNNNIIQQCVTPQPQQYVCVDNTSQGMQPTIINQIPVFNPLQTNASCQSVMNVPHSPLQRATSVIIQHPQPQSQPLQIIQQQPQPLQVIQQAQPGQQFLQFAPSGQQIIQTIQPQVIQAPSVLRTVQMPGQAIGGNPQILYQRPYDPIVMPIQNQQLAIANPSLVALSQPSYAPARIASAASGGQLQGPNMFRHALLQTVAGRAGVPLPPAGSNAGGGGIQLMQQTVASPMGSNPKLLFGGGIQRSASLPIVPLTAGGLLIPFQPSQAHGGRSALFPRASGQPSGLRNFNDIRQQIQQQRAQIAQNLQQQQQNYNRRIPSPPVISAAPRTPNTPYSAGNMFSSGARSGGTPLLYTGPSSYGRPPSLGPTYSRPNSTGMNYSPPSIAGSNIGSVGTSPYRAF